MFILLLYLEVLVTNPYDAALSSARIEEEKKITLSELANY